LKNSRRWRELVSFSFLTVCLACGTVTAQGQQLTEAAQRSGQDTSKNPQTSTPDTSGQPGATREATWRKLPKNFLQDQKEIWLFPVHVAEGRHWLPTAIVVGGTAGLIAADPQIEPHLRQTTAFHGFNRVFTSTVSGGLIAVVPAAFYATSLIRKNSYDQSTGLLAGEAVVDDTVLMVALKSITQRLRPTDIPPNGSYADSFFQSNRSPIGKGTSFPSGHAMMGFSVATVFARRYRQHKWVPYVAYGLASVISFSRITNQAHFASDVFFGAAAGFAIARFDVVRQ